MNPIRQFHELYAWAANQPSLQWLRPWVRGPKFVARMAISIVRTPDRMMRAAWTIGRAIGPLRWLLREGAQHIRANSPPTPGTKPLIVMLANAHLPADPRIEREARALVAGGFRIKILCPEWCPGAVVPDWGPDIEIKLLPQSAGQYVCYFPWVLGLSMIRAADEERPWAYHGHDLDTSIAALLAAARHQTLCICDFHEWYSENASLGAWRRRYRPHSWIKKWIFRKTERLALRHASQVVTVCDSIAQALEENYQCRRSPVVVRNIPSLSQNPSGTPQINIRERFGIPANKAIVLYQGGVGPSRGLEPIIKAMALVRSAVLVLRGPGVEMYGKIYVRIARENGAEDRVFWLPPVPSSRCVAEAQAADIGVWTLLPICRNFTYALPNKVFEYCAAGLPMVCAHHREVRKIVEGYELGACFDPEDPSSIAAAIEKLAGDAPLRKRCSNNTHTALAHMQADREWEKLVAIYRRLATAERVTLPPAAVSEAESVRKAG